MCDLFLLGQELLLTVRGQPVIYYGDEQGMVGTGNDMGAREDMFPSRAPKFRDLALLGTTRRGGDDKFDVEHPFYKVIHSLASLRTSSPALARGAMLVRDAKQPHLFAFSRIERNERVEFLVALNNSRTEVANATLATCQPAGAAFERIFDSRDPNAAASPALIAGAEGRVTLAGAASIHHLEGQGSITGAKLATDNPLCRACGSTTLSFTERTEVGQIIPERGTARGNRGRRRIRRGDLHVGTGIAAEPI